MNRVIKVKSIKKINQNKEFKRIYSRGNSLVSGCLVTYFLKNTTRDKKIGITTSKKIGNAVNRNRARRIIFEAYRKILSHVRSGYDYVFLARNRTCTSKTQDIVKSMIFQIKRAGLWI